MSTLKADTIQSTGGGAATLTKQSAAKAWLQLNGATFAIRESFNISSATDNSQGDHTGSYTNSMDSTTYAINNFVAGGDDRRSAHSARDSQASGSWSLIARSSVPADNNAKVDEQKVIGVIHGDLA